MRRSACRLLLERSSREGLLSARCAARFPRTQRSSRLSDNASSPSQPGRGSSRPFPLLASVHLLVSRELLVRHAFPRWRGSARRVAPSARAPPPPPPPPPGAGGEGPTPPPARPRAA